MLTISVLAMAGVASAPASAGRPDQQVALEAVRAGRAQPLPLLERRVVPQVRGDYMGGAEYDPGANTYRMKFMRGQSVIWIDVDGQTGRIVRRSGE